MKHNWKDGFTDWYKIYPYRRLVAKHVTGPAALSSKNSKFIMNVSVNLHQNVICEACNGLSDIYFRFPQTKYGNYVCQPYILDERRSRLSTKFSTSIHCELYQNYLSLCVTNLIFWKKSSYTSSFGLVLIISVVSRVKMGIAYVWYSNSNNT